MLLGADVGIGVWGRDLQAGVRVWGAWMWWGGRAGTHEHHCAAGPQHSSTEDSRHGSTVKGTLVVPKLDTYPAHPHFPTPTGYLPAVILC